MLQLPTNPIAIAVHGGAGVSHDSITAEGELAYHRALEEALLAGHAVLTKSGNSLDAVLAAVTQLEDCPLFNAGRGSVLNYDGQALMDAAVMNGADLVSGAVTNVTTVKNPVLLAHAVTRSPHVFLSGEGAEEYARWVGLPCEAPSYFVTPARREEWRAALPSLVATTGGGTVGAVALDSRGNVAAATSTGGMLLKRWGRIGDSPVVGAGTYADNRAAAVSATGHGEIFLRTVAAHDVCARVRYTGCDLATACRQVLAEVERLGGMGGLIAVEPRGSVVMDFVADGMFRGSIDADGRLTTYIW